jgi:sulfatase modifying factor 1
MRFRAFAVVPVVLGGLSLALSAAQTANAKGPSGKPTVTAAATASGDASHGRKKTHKGNKHATHKGDPSTPHPTLATALRTDPRDRGFDVVEGAIGQAMPGAVCPPEMANVDDRFCVDRWEGSLVEVTRDGRDLPWPAFGPLEDGHQLRAVSVPNVYPQAYISGAQAARVCAAAGKRLCAPVEWRKACEGPKSQKFGYGNDRASGKCNDAGYSPMLRLFPQVAVSWNLVGMTEMNDPRLNQLDQTLAPTGSHEQCTNDYGVFDMVGNLHEWTSDPNGTFQGGYYLDTHRNGDGCAYRTVAHEFTYHDYSTGFRCCADPVVP